MMLVFIVAYLTRQRTLFDDHVIAIAIVKQMEFRLKRWRRSDFLGQLSPLGARQAVCTNGCVGLFLHKDLIMNLCLHHKPGCFFALSALLVLGLLIGLQLLCNARQNVIENIHSFAQFFLGNNFFSKTIN